MKTKSNFETFCDNAPLMIESVRIFGRPDLEGFQSLWDNEASHFQVKISNTSSKNAPSVLCFYSQGSGRKGDPKLADVLSCLLLDAQMTEAGFEAYCDDLDIAESIEEYARFRQSRRMAKSLRKVLGDIWDKAIEAAQDY